MKKTIPLLAIFYGIVVFALGVMGYKHAGSLISFLVGGSLGALVIISGFYMLLEKKFAYYCALFLTLLLGIFFGVRFSIRHDFLFISMAFFSAIVLTLITIEIFRFSHRAP